jgi:phospholipid-binding lipoprotein MlaA
MTFVICPETPIAGRSSGRQGTSMSFSLITAAMVLVPSPTGDAPPFFPASALPPSDRWKEQPAPAKSGAIVPLILRGALQTGPGPVTVPEAPAPQTSVERTSGDPSTQTAEPSDEVVVSGRRSSATDPLERANVQSFKAVQAVDGAIVAPLARGYKKGLPRPIRRGIHNFLDHVQEPIVFLNYLLQLKPGKAAETLGRFAINSTIGLAGVVDVAKKKPFNLPHRPNSLANTLGYYGVGPGPYLFLPIIGPTTVRDLFGLTVDRLVLPTTVGAPFNKAYYTIPTSVLSALDYRVAFDDRLSEIQNSADPYAASRKHYLDRRKAEIDRLHSPKWRALHVPPAQPPMLEQPPVSQPVPALSPTNLPAPAGEQALGEGAQAAH